MNEQRFFNNVVKLIDPATTAAAQANSGSAPPQAAQATGTRPGGAAIDWQGIVSLVLTLAAGVVVLGVLAIVLFRPRVEPPPQPVVAVPIPDAAPVPAEAVEHALTMANSSSNPGNAKSPRLRRSPFDPSFHVTAPLRPAPTTAPAVGGPQTP